MTLEDLSSGVSTLQVHVKDSVPVLVIPDDLPFNALREWLRQEVPLRQSVINGRASRLDLGTRELNLFDLRRLVHLLRDEMSVEVTGLYVLPEAIHRYAERELKLKLFAVEESVPEVADLEPDTSPDPEEPEAPEIGEAIVAAVTEDAATEAEEPEAPTVEEAVEAPSDRVIPIPRPDMPPERERSEDGRRTLVMDRTLRSGTRVQFEGDVTIYGDVNPGAQVVAAGNVLILGSVKGMVHAGALGDEDRFVLAFDLRPIQLRIGRKIAIPPERGPDDGTISPEIARIVDGQILIERYRGRMPR